MAIQLYSAIHYTAIQRYTVYMLYIIPLTPRRRRPAEPEGVKLKSFRRGPRTSGGVSIRPFVSFGWGLINTATRRANGNAAEQLEL